MHVFVSLNMKKIRGIGKSSFGTKSFLFGCNMIVIHHNAPEMSSSFVIWIWISGFFLFCCRLVLKFLLEVAPSCKERWITAVFLARFRLSCMWIQIHCLSVHTFWFVFFFAWISECGIVLRSSVSTNFPSVQRRIQWIFLEGLFCRTDVLELGISMILDWNLLLLQWNGRRANGELMRRPSGVWSFTGRSKRISEISKKLCCFCSSPSLKSRLNQHWRRFFLSLVEKLVLQFICFRLGRSLMVPIQFFASFEKTPENCAWRWNLGFLVGVWIFDDFCAFLEMTCLCMDNLNTLSCQVLRDRIMFVKLSRLLLFNEYLVVCCYHIDKSFGIFSLSARSSYFSAWCSRNFRASAYFAVGVPSVHDFFCWRNQSGANTAEAVLPVTEPHNWSCEGWDLKDTTVDSGGTVHNYGYCAQDCWLKHGAISSETEWMNCFFRALFEVGFAGACAEGRSAGDGFFTSQRERRLSIVTIAL